MYIIFFENYRKQTLIDHTSIFFVLTSYKSNLLLSLETREQTNVESEGPHLIHCMRKFVDCLNGFNSQVIFISLASYRIIEQSSHPNNT